VTGLRAKTKRFIIKHLQTTITSINIIYPEHITESHVLENIPTNEVTNSGAEVSTVPED
jgi:hypothetical protein